MALDLVIKNGKVVTPFNVMKASIGISDGKIVWLGENSVSPSTEQTIDAEGKHVIPGCIDVHVHFREPLRPDKEDWSTGSKSAICGGVTTVLDMPESVEPTVEGLNKKLDSALSKSVVDFGMYGRPTTPENVEALSKAGVIAYKILLGYEQFVPDDGTFFRLLKAIGKTYLPAAVHAEDINIVKSLRDHLLKEGKKDIEAHELSRPTFIEEEAIAKRLSSLKLGQDRCKTEKSRKAGEDVECIVIAWNREDIFRINPAHRAKKKNTAHNINQSQNHNQNHNQPQ